MEGNYIRFRYLKIPIAVVPFKIPLCWAAFTSWLILDYSENHRGQGAFSVENDVKPVCIIRCVSTLDHVQPQLSMTLSHQISYIFSSTRAKQRSPAIFMSVCLSISATLSRLATVVVGME